MVASGMAEHMNGAKAYSISNALTPADSIRSHRGEYFDLLGKLRRTRYSEVSWNNEPMHLPQPLVDRFFGKVMAITGFEVDIVRPRPDGSFESVSSHEQYNHHFTGFFYGNASAIGGRQVNAKRAQAAWSRTGQNSIVDHHMRMIMFSEGNGNEHRRTLRAVARGFAYLLYSPVLWDNVPMIINTNKRLTHDTSPGPIARLQPRRSLAPRGHDATYNGLIECPCTSRKIKRFKSYSIWGGEPDSRACGGVSSSVVETVAECAHAASRLAAWQASNDERSAANFYEHLVGLNVSTIDDSSLPPGCLTWTNYSDLVFNQPYMLAHSIPSAAATQLPLTDHDHHPFTSAADAFTGAPTTPTSTESTHAHSPSLVQLCRNVSDSRGTIDGTPFRPTCAPAPRSELVTGNNPVCNLSSYVGGDLCCASGSLLLDADQVVPEPLDSYRLRYRFWYEDYTNQSNALYGWWSISATNPEYIVPQATAPCAEPQTPHASCVHELRSKITGRDLLTKFGPEMAIEVAADGLTVRSFPYLT